LLPFYPAEKDLTGIRVPVRVSSHIVARENQCVLAGTLCVRELLTGTPEIGPRLNRSVVPLACIFILIRIGNKVTRSLKSRHSTIAFRVVYKWDLLDYINIITKNQTYINFYLL